MLVVFLRLLLSAYGVTLSSVPVITLVDYRMTLANPQAAQFALVPGFLDRLVFIGLVAVPYALAGAVMATLLYWLGVRWWRGQSGRLVFVLLCAAIGAAQLMFTVDAYLVIGAVSAGTAAWVATWPEHNTRLLPQLGLVVGTGVGSGVLQFLLMLWT